MVKQRRAWAAVILIGAVAVAASRASADDPVFDTQVYKTVGNRELNVRIQKHAEARPGDTRPAIVLFHGGGWVG